MDLRPRSQSFIAKHPGGSFVISLFIPDSCRLCGLGTILFLEIMEAFYPKITRLKSIHYQEMEKMIEKKEK